MRAKILLLAFLLATGGMAEAQTAIDIKLDSCNDMIESGASVYDWADWEGDIWAIPMLSRSVFPHLTFDALDSDTMDIGPTDAWKIITECRKMRDATP